LEELLVWRTQQAGMASPRRQGTLLQAQVVVVVAHPLLVMGVMGVMVAFLRAVVVVVAQPKPAHNPVQAVQAVQGLW
jgi:hypothetical protein